MSTHGLSIEQLEERLQEINVALRRNRAEMDVTFAQAAGARAEVDAFIPAAYGPDEINVARFLVLQDYGEGSEYRLYEAAKARLAAAMQPYYRAEERWHKLRFELEQHSLWLSLSRQRQREVTANDRRLEALLH